MLKQRIITASILAPLAIAAVLFLSTAHFALLSAAVMALAGWEWAQLAGLRAQPVRWGYGVLVLSGCALAWYLPLLAVLGVAAVWWLAGLLIVIGYPENLPRWNRLPLKLAMGLVVLVPAWLALVNLHGSEHRNALLLLLFGLIWGADIGAYCFGKRFGRRKLAPKVSPGKSWEGVFGGLLTATLVALLFGVQAELSGSMHWALLLGGTWLIVAASVVGDLLESCLKREQGIKDSSQLLPGHGGIMDRIDSLTAAAPLFVLLLCFAGGH